MKTYGQLLAALIEYYENAIKVLPEDDIKRDDFLIDKYLDCGICLCAEVQFDLHIYNHDFTKKFTNRNLFLCETPAFRTFEESKQSLQTRIDRMKEMFNEWKYIELE